MGARGSRRTTRTHGTLLMKMRQNSFRFSSLFSLNRSFRARLRRRNAVIPLGLAEMGRRWIWSGRRSSSEERSSVPGEEEEEGD